MKIFKQLSVILLIYFISVVIVRMLGISFPAGIVGMILLLICLKFKIVRLEQVDTISDFFLGNMAFFFIPAGVSIMVSYHYLSGGVWQILALTIVTTVIVFAATGRLTQYFVRKKESKK